MSTYSRYLIAQITRPMVTTIVVALVALLAERTLRVVDLVVGWRGSLLVIFEMLGYLVPHYMGLALPVAFFLGILLTFARLSREGELAAIFASGTGLPQLLRPLLVASLVLAVVTGLLMSHIQPYARYAYRAAVAALTNASFHTLLQEGIFTTVGRTTYMMEGLSADKRELSGVFLHSRDDEGNAVTVTAERGEVNRAGAMAPVELTLANGLQQLVPAAKPRPDGDDVPSEVVLRFRAFETTIAGSGDALAPRGEDEREMTLPELWQNRGRKLGSIDAEEIEAELAGRLVRILSLPALPLMAVPLALGRIRGQRSYGLVVGLGALIVFHQVLQFGEALADNGEISALLGLWLPFGVFVALSLFLFVRSATRVPDPKGAAWLDRAVDSLVGIGRRVGLLPAMRA